MTRGNRIVEAPPLLALDGHEFIEQAYLAILGRSVDETGRSKYFGELSRGKSKLVILNELADSPEGLAAGRRVDQRESIPSAGRKRRIPLIGRAISFISDLIRMPSTVIDLHRRELAAAEEAVSPATVAADAALRRMEDLAGLLNHIQENVSQQGQHLRTEVQREVGALSSYIRTELPKTDMMSYLTCFMDVRQHRLSMQMAGVQQNILDNIQQAAEVLATALREVGLAGQGQLADAKSEIVRRLEESYLNKSGQLLEAITEHGKAQAWAIDRVAEIRAETAAAVVRLDGTLENRSRQLLDAINEPIRSQTAPAALEAPIRDCATQLAASREVLKGILQTLGQLQNRVAVAADDVFRNQVGTNIDQLSAAAADFLNWAGGHTGYSAQKNIWINHPFFPVHASGNVSVGYMNERILEIPYALASAMRLPAGSSIIDCGCCENWVGVALAQAGYKVTGIDIRAYPIQAPNFTFRQQALEDWDGPPEPVDAILSLSSLEHFGLGAYGGPTSGNSADRELLAKMAGWLKPHGLLILTAPYGIHSVDNFQRVYDSAALRSLMCGWRIQEARYYYTDDGAAWICGDEALDTHPFQYPGRAVVMLQARRAV